MCMYAYISKQAGKTRGILGDAPQEIFRNYRSEIASGATFGQKQSRSFIQFLAVQQGLKNRVLASPKASSYIIGLVATE